MTLGVTHFKLITLSEPTGYVINQQA